MYCSLDEINNKWELDDLIKAYKWVEYIEQLEVEAQAQAKQQK